MKLKLLFLAILILLLPKTLIKASIGHHPSTFRSAKMAWRALALLQKELENETKTTVPCYTYPTITKNANKGFYRPSPLNYEICKNGMESVSIASKGA